MKAYLISDNVDTFVGLKVAGIDGVVLKDKVSILNELNKLKSNKDIGIIIMTEKAAALVEDKVKEMKLAKSTPLIVEIPDRHGTIKGDDYILNYVKESIGLKI